MKQRTVQEYMNLPYTIEVIKDPDCGGYVASVKELRGCMTQADTYEELGEMIDEAMRLWLEVALEDGIPIPEPRPQETYSGKFVVRVPRSLHRELAEAAEREGVSLNAMVNLAISRGLYRKESGAREENLPLNSWLEKAKEPAGK